MVNETHCIILHTLHNYNVTQFTLKHSSYKNCNNQLSNRMIYLLKYYVSAFTNTKSDHIHSLFGIILLGVDAVLRHATVK